MLDEVIRRYGVESAAWAFAAHWASDWLRRAVRLAPAPVRPASIVIGDASRDDLDPDTPYIRALELFCLRAGVRVLRLSARGVSGIGDAVAIHRPNLVIVAGSHLDDESIARWAYAIRLSAGAVPIAVYRRGDDPRGQHDTPTARRAAGGAGADPRADGRRAGRAADGVGGANRPRPARRGRRSAPAHGQLAPRRARNDSARALPTGRRARTGGTEGNEGAPQASPSSAAGGTKRQHRGKPGTESSGGPTRAASICAF